jgi:hypothetical protein
MPLIAYIPFAIFIIVILLMLWAVIGPKLKKYKIVEAKPRKKRRQVKSNKRKKKFVWVRIR